MSTMTCGWTPIYNTRKDSFTSIRPWKEKFVASARIKPAITNSWGKDSNHLVYQKPFRSLNRGFVFGCLSAYLKPIYSCCLDYWPRDRTKRQPLTPGNVTDLRVFFFLQVDTLHLTSSATVDILDFSPRFRTETIRLKSILKTAANNVVYVYQRGHMSSWQCCVNEIQMVSYYITKADIGTGQHTVRRRYFWPQIGGIDEYWPTCHQGIGVDI